MDGVTPSMAITVGVHPPQAPQRSHQGACPKGQLALSWVRRLHNAPAMSPIRKRAEAALRREWRPDAQVVQCCDQGRKGELCGLAISEGTISRYRLMLASDDLTLIPLLRTFSWERRRPQRPNKQIRNFTAS